MKKEEMKRKVCLGDTVVIGMYGMRKEGVVELISLRGVNIRNEEGVHFYKWSDVVTLKKGH